MNEFGDLTREEFKRDVVRGCLVDDELFAREPVKPVAPIQLPAPIDWRAKKAVTSVKDQKQCGACWIFAAITTLEGAWAIKTGNLLELSQQQLVDW